MVDANVERVVARLFAVETELPAAREEIYRLAGSITPEGGSGDFAQAMMDLGATICTPRSPRLRPLPARRALRGAGGRRSASLSAQGGEGGRSRGGRGSPIGSSMTAMSCSSGGRPGGCSAGCWRCRPTATALRPRREWREAGSVDHVFTHFALNMRLLCAAAESRPAGTWWPIERIGEAGLPTLFARLAARGAEWRAAA